jgi:type IV pilus assembly protein PilM
VAQSSFSIVKITDVTGEIYMTGSSKFTGNFDNRQFRHQGRYSPIGLDLDSTHLKIVQLQRCRDGLTTYQKCIIPTPSGTLINGRIANSAILIKQLKQIRQSQPWIGSTTNLSVHCKDSYVKVVEMPAMRKRELQQAMQLEAESRFSIDVDKSFIAYNAIYSMQNDSAKQNRRPKSERYVLTVLAKEIAACYFNVLSEAGFKPLSMEAPVAPLLRSINHTNPVGMPKASNASRSIIIDFGRNSTLLLITDRNGYYYHRSINIGSDEFMQAMTNRWPSLKLNAHKALYIPETLEKKGLLPLTQRLAHSIGQTLDHCFGQHISASACLTTQIACCGEGIYIPGLANHLQSALNMKLTLYNPLELMNDRTKEFKENQNRYGPLLSLAFGLALQGWVT